MNIGIIGAGTAGSATALFLARAGHTVTVYEGVARPGPVGAGIMLQPTGQAVLAQLGLIEPILRSGARIHHLEALNTAGKTILDLRYKELSPGLFGLGLHRGVLFQTLFEAASKEATVRCGIHIQDLAKAEEGRWLLDKEGNRYGPHQLVVVADGAGSDLRDDTDLGPDVRIYPWGALWFIGENPPFPDRLHQRVEGTRRMLGLLPTGASVDSIRPHLSLFWSIRGDQVENWKLNFSAWKNEAFRMEPAAEEVLAQIREPDQMLFARYRDERMRRWNTENVVYIGDAAHAMSPQLGQGANLALLDAAVLADCLRTGPLATSLDAYSKRRRNNLFFYQLATRWLTPWFQSDLQMLAPFRDRVMPLSIKIPWVRRQMLASMAGLKNGLFSIGTLQTFLEG
jgi:2-polyprenyl-6-methoxyphenol hydroxylase-like FAD-dependent oxidoreductase